MACFDFLFAIFFVLLAAVSALPINLVSITTAARFAFTNSSSTISAPAFRHSTESATSQSTVSALADDSSPANARSLGLITIKPNPVKGAAISSSSSSSSAAAPTATPAPAAKQLFDLASDTQLTIQLIDGKIVLGFVPLPPAAPTTIPPKSAGAHTTAETGVSAEAAAALEGTHVKRDAAPIAEADALPNADADADADADAEAGFNQDKPTKPTWSDLEGTPIEPHLGMDAAPPAHGNPAPKAPGMRGAIPEAPATPHAAPGEPHEDNRSHAPMGFGTPPLAPGWSPDAGKMTNGYEGIDPNAV